MPTEICGYAGNILHVNLTTGAIKKDPLNVELAKKFLGGFGINTRLAYDLIKPGVEPFSPENVIIIGAGPLIGTLAPACNKMQGTTKYPAWDAVWTSGCGCLFGCMLKWAGYDHLIITGKAEEPVYLKIFDDDVKIRDANQLWGKDLYQATDELWSKHGRNCSIYCIGPASERLVKISLGFVDKIHSFGKGGLAAVMGSKNLKAIVAFGTRGIKVSDPKRFMKAVDRALETILKDPRYEERITLGKLYPIRSPTAYTYWTQSRWPYKNFSALFPIEKISELFKPDVYLEKVKKAGVACPTCPQRCKDIIEVREGEHAGLITYASSFYGRLMNLGIRLNLGGYNKVSKALDLLNRYGIDCHSWHALVDFIVDLYERGVITKQDSDSLELRRDFDTIIKLIEKTAHREGLGDILADGWMGVIKKIEGAEKHACITKWIESKYEARVFRMVPEVFRMVVNPAGDTEHIDYVGPCYNPESLKSYIELIGTPKEAVDRIFIYPRYLGFPEARIGRATKYVEDFMCVKNSLGAGCIWARGGKLGISDLAELYSAATGFKISPTELLRAGERAWNALKAINVKEGFTRKDDVFPKRWFEPLKVNGEKIYLMHYSKTQRLTMNDADKLLDEYYEERGWNNKTGTPTKRKLTDLELDFISL